jgi:small subunit ribosomal protein S4
MALMEKQKIKHYYGLGERQLRRYFDKAGRQKGTTGQNLLLTCERRLDNVARPFSSQRYHGQQAVLHASSWRRHHGSPTQELAKRLP